MTPTSKIDALHVADWVPWRQPGTYHVERTTGPVRIVAAPGGRHVEIMLALAAALHDPFAILYVLHTPRGGSKAGRYQSPPIDRAAVNRFFASFGEFLASDGRHDIWLRSFPDEATLVWDRHDLLYAYGPIELLEGVLHSHQLTRGAVSIPSPHAHRYHQGWDEQEHAVLGAFQWIESPLQPQDEEGAP